MGRIKIGVSSASYFDRLSLPDIITDFGDHNLTDCELFLNTWSEYTPEYVSALKERIGSLRAPLCVNSVHPMSTQFEPQLFSVHKSQRKDAFFVYEQVLKAACELGAHLYVMHGPIMLKNGANPPSLERFIPVFRELSDMAAAYGVMLSLENVSWCLFSSPAVGEALADALGDKLHYTLDIKQAYRSGIGYTPKAYLDAVGPLIVNVHLCDHIPSENGFNWVLPGKGVIDWKQIFCDLANIGYKGKAFIESYSNSYGSTDELYTSLRFLEEICK